MLRTEESGNLASLVVLKVKIAVRVWSKSGMGRNVNYVLILKLFKHSRACYEVIRVSNKN